jgi:hypothetical protein
LKGTNKLFAQAISRPDQAVKNRQNSTIQTIMKTSKHSFGARVALYTLTATALLASTNRACAQANLSFSGGNNTPFVLTLNAPVTYVINAALTSNAPFFVFKNVGNPLGSQQSVAASISFSVNGGSAQTITTENSGAAVGNITANDLFFFGPFPALNIGDTVTLTTGTTTTNSNVASAPPAGGNFNTFLTDSNGVQISTAGVTAIPEPTIWALFALGGTALLGYCCRPVFRV